MSSDNYDKDFADFFMLITELIRKLNLLERDEKVCFGFTISQCCIIDTISKSGRLSMKELGQRVGVAVSTVTRLLDVLERDGIVKRMISPDDRRVVMVSLTDTGNDAAVILKECSENYLKSIFSDIPDTRRDVINESLNLLLRSIKQHPSCCVK